MVIGESPVEVSPDTIHWCWLKFDSAPFLLISRLDIWEDAKLPLQLVQMSWRSSPSLSPATPVTYRLVCVGFVASPTGHNKSLNLLLCANVEQSPTSSLCHHSPRLPSYKWWNTFQNLSPKHARAISSSPECSLCQGRQTPLWRFLPPRPEHQIKTLAFIPFTQFVSSDWSSYSDGGRQYIDTATFWDFEHFCQYI